MTVRFSATSPIINWNESAKPFGEKLFQAVEYLKFRARNFNALAAYETVEKFVAEQQKYLLFRQFFPDEWQRSQTSLFKAGVYENYTERANEFFELVNEHLFPILGGWYQEPEADLDNFNIYSLNVDFCCDEPELEYLQVSYVAASLIFSQADEIWDYFEENFKLKRKDFPEINRYCFDKIWDLEKTGRLGLYLNIFEVVDHSTGTPWLDNTNCQYSENYSWDEKTVRFLTESYRQAREMLKKTELLDELIEANPKEILSEMISLWNTGQISSFKNKRRTKRENQVGQIR